MSKFLDCFCDEDLTALGDAPAEVLDQAWVLILSEYLELKGDVDSQEHIALSRDILRMQDHLDLLGISIKVLKDRYSESIAESVCKLGYPFRPADKDPKNYQHLLVKIVEKSKTKHIQLQQLISQLQAKLENIGVKKPSREHFEGLLMAIEHLQKVQYSMEQLTVTRFVTLEKAYWRHIEIANAKKY